MVLLQKKRKKKTPVPKGGRGEGKKSVLKRGVRFTQKVTESYCGELVVLENSWWGKEAGGGRHKKTNPSKNGTK